MLFKYSSTLSIPATSTRFRASYSRKAYLASFTFDLNLGVKSGYAQHMQTASLTPAEHIFTSAELQSDYEKDHCTSLLH